MLKNIKLFTNHSAYEAVKNNIDKPNVVMCLQEDKIYFNPYVPPRMDIITYRASAKLTETTDDSASGLHTNAFNTTIKSHTFKNGVGIIEFNSNVTSIGNKAFKSCNNMTSIDIPNSVTSIGNTAFSYCTSLTSIIIPDSVTTIGEDAFYRCSGITSVTFGSSLTSIGYYAFDFCSRITSITSTATTAPSISSTSFRNIKQNGILYVPIGSSGYDAWMSSGEYYLGKYNWTKVEQ